MDDEFSELILPEYKDWSVVAVKLLRGVLYSDEDKSDWGALTRFRGELQNHFARIGLLLVTSESEGYAYLRQIEEDDKTDDAKYQEIPRLFYRRRLNYAETMVCVLLRQRLHDFDELSNLDDDRCVAEEDELFDDWKKMIPDMPDEKKTKGQFDAAMNKLKDVQFIKQIGNQTGRWEVRRIIKARIPLEKLENLLKQLQKEYNGGTVEEGNG